MRRLNATALIYSHVYNHGAVWYILEHAAGHQPWSGRAWNQHCTHDQVRGRNRIVNHVSARCESGNLGKENIIKLTQPIQVVVDDSNVSTHTHSNFRSVGADDAPADNYHPGSRNAGYAAEQNTAAAGHFLEVVSSDLNGHAPRDFGHRREQRQPTSAIRDRFVGNAGDFAFDELVGEFTIRCEVQIGKQQLTIAHSWVFRRDRFLDLDDH